MHRASTRPVWVSEAGIANTRRIQIMGSPQRKGMGQSKSSNRCAKLNASF
jgi:hypothetical protein